MVNLVVGMVVEHVGESWGRGVVVSVAGDRCVIHWESKPPSKFVVATVAGLVREVDVAEVAEDSALRHPKRWHELTGAPSSAVKRAQGKREVRRKPSLRCSYCDKMLNWHQYRSGKAWKACPNCSHVDGRQHVFKPYPAAFGTSDARISDQTRDGAQSWCTSRRRNDESLRGEVRRCDQFG